MSVQPGMTGWVMQTSKWSGFMPKAKTTYQTVQSHCVQWKDDGL